MSVTVITQPQTTTYNVEVTRNETTYNVAVSLQRGPIGPAPTLTFPAPTAVSAGGSPTVQVSETSPGVYSIQFGLVTGATGPAGLNWDDEHPTWDETKQYAVHDAVYYNGSSYWAAEVPAVGQAPDPDASDPWQELAIMGQKGEAATVSVGTVTTGEPGSDATVTNSGTSSAAVLDFAIPQGEPGAGVPDTTGATDGDVVRFNGTTTEWSALGTAADADTGTTSGDIPVLGTGGRLAIARLASGTPDGTKFVRDDGTLAVPSAVLSRLSGTLAADVALGTSLGTVLTCSGFTAGTWLVMVTLTVVPNKTNSVNAEFQAVAGTGAPTLAGPTAGGTAVSSGISSTNEAQAVLTFFVTCTTASTITIQGLGANGSPAPTVKASTVTSTLANASGWTAIKVA